MALDPEAMARLEHLYPDIKFDWDRILREPPQTLSEEEAARRKDQRDARDARRRRKRLPPETAEEAETPKRAETQRESAADPGGQASAGPRFDEDGRDEGQILESDGAKADLASEGDVLIDVVAGDEGITSEPGSATPAAIPSKRRRRRRRPGRKRGGEPGSNPPGGAPPTGSV